MLVEVSEAPDAEWNAYLLGSMDGTIYQSTFYAEYAKREVGFKPFFLRAEENGDTKGQLVLFKGSRFHGFLANQPLHGFTTKIARALVPSFSWVYGPAAESDEAARLLLDEAKKIAGGRRISCSPHPLRQFENAFAAAGFKSRKWATFVIDLSKTEEELWNAVDKSARKLVNRTLERVDVKPVENETEYRAYHAVLNENRKRNRVLQYRYSPFLWKVWRESGTGEVFIAVDKQSREVLAGLGVSCFNGYVNEWGAGTSTRALKEHVYAQDAVKWTVIRDAKQRGCRFFDFTGVNPEPRDEKEKGIYRFKEKWGGKLVEYNEYSCQPSTRF